MLEGARPCVLVEECDPPQQVPYLPRTVGSDLIDLCYLLAVGCEAHDTIGFAYSCTQIVILEKAFEFDHALDPLLSQKDVYKATARPLLERSEGYAACRPSSRHRWP